MKEKNIRELARRMELVTPETMRKYSITQLVLMIANKVNELIGEVGRFESDVVGVVKTQNENIKYLLDKGLHLEVANVFDGWVKDGTFDTLINQTALKKVNDRIDETNVQLSFVVQDIYSKLHSSDMFLPQKRGVDMQMGGFFTNDMIKSTLLKLKELNITDICICPYLELESPTSSNISRISSLSDIREILSFAKDNGIKINHVKLHFTSPSSVNPSNEELFLTNYQSILLETLELCLEFGVEYYGVANELAKVTSKNVDMWSVIISKLKSKGVKVFTSCTYEEKDTSLILGLVDVIGINFYPSLSNKGGNATIEECQKMLYGNRYIQSLKEIKEKYNKPLWLTELGCVRSSKALSQPSNSSLEVDSEGDRVQGVFFNSTLPIIGGSYHKNKPLIDGVFIWCCSNINPPDKFNFINNPYAEPVVLKYYQMKGVE